MLRILVLAAAALALLGCGGSEDAAAPRETTTATTTQAPPPPAEELLAVWNDLEGSELFWADAQTLEPVDGRSVSFSYYYSAVDRSPDGNALALGADDRGYVQVVDLERMKALGTIDVGTGGYFERLHWVAPDLLLASVSGLPSRAVAIDPGARRVLSEHELEGTVVSSHPTEDGIVFLLAPPDRIGPARLAVFDGTGVRTTELREIRAGWEQEGETEEDYRARQSIPGLAVEPSGVRALVVPAGNRVAEVDLETLDVRYHDLSEPVSLLGRLRDWLEPAAAAKTIDGPDRTAVWLSNGLVAVSGVDYVAEGEERMAAEPAGLALVDPSDWSIHRVNDETGWVAVRDDTLLASWWQGDDSGEAGVVAYDLEGNERFRRTSGELVDFSYTAGGHLYAAGNEGRLYELIDLGTGETVSRVEPERPAWLVYLDE
ncbi:MAG: hypothetical protein ACRDNI_05880 [Gaiellaceae bacterium]